MSNPQPSQTQSSLAGQHVIACYAYGDMQIQDCTVEVAMSFFETYKSSVPDEIARLAELDSNHRPVSGRLLVDIIKDAGGKLEVGSPFGRLRQLRYGAAQRGEEDSRPEVLVTQEMADQVALWAGRNGLKIADLHSTSVAEKNALEQIGFLRDAAEADPRTWVLVSFDEYVEAARQYRTIVKAQWKEGALEHKKAGYILKFVKEWLADDNVRVLEVVTIRGQTGA